MQKLIEKVNGNARLVSVEIEKLAVFVGVGGTIDENTVNELVPNFGEGDFFEATDAFFGQFGMDFRGSKTTFFLKFGIASFVRKPAIEKSLNDPIKNPQRFWRN